MSGGQYAATTSVPVGRTYGEIESTLTKYGATGFMLGQEHGDNPRAAVAFHMRGRHIRFTLPLPNPGDDEFWLTPSGKWSRTDAQAKAAWEQKVRARWRALHLIIKAKLEAVDAGVVEFDTEFMAQLVMADGRTVGDAVGDQLGNVLGTGELPALLPGGGGR